MKRISFIAAIAVIIALLSVFPASAAGADVWDGTFPTADKTGKNSGGEGTRGIPLPHLVGSRPCNALVRDGGRRVLRGKIF